MALNKINFTGSIDGHQLAFFMKHTQLAVYEEAAADLSNPLDMIGQNYAVLRAEPDAAGKIEAQYVEIWGTKSNMHVVSNSYDTTDLTTLPTREDSDEFMFNGYDGCIFWAYNSGDDNIPPYLIVGTGDFRNIGLVNLPPELIYIPIPNDSTASVVIICTANYKLEIRH